MMYTLMLAAVMLLSIGMVSANTVVVTEESVGNNDKYEDEWFISTMGLGQGDFVEGPDSPPYGTGSFQLLAEDLAVDKVTITTSNYLGETLSGIQGLSYWTYRVSEGIDESIPSHVTPSINIEIVNGGPDGEVTWATLVWEPVYAYGASAITDDEWQNWDTFAQSQTSFAGGWWTTRTLGDVCEFNCFVSWDTIIENNPHAEILVTGVNLGRGPGSGSYVANTDGLSILYNGTQTTYDFELTVESTVPTHKDECKQGGWMSFDVEFRNQGQCVSYVQANERAGKR